MARIHLAEKELRKADYTKEGACKYIEDKVSSIIFYTNRIKSLLKAKTIENDLVQAALVDLEETIEKLGEIPKITSKQTPSRGRFR